MDDRYRKTAPASLPLHASASRRVHATPRWLPVLLQAAAVWRASQYAMMGVGCRDADDPLGNVEMWGGLEGRGKDAVVAMREWGMAPRMFGGGMLMTLSDLGLVPRVDVIQVPRFDVVWPPADTRPVRLRRVTLEDVFKAPAAAGQGLLQRLFRKAALEVRSSGRGSATAAAWTCMQTEPLTFV